MVHLKYNDSEYGHFLGRDNILEIYRLLPWTTHLLEAVLRKYLFLNWKQSPSQIPAE